jgi:GWxTD domain-containing protein
MRILERFVETPLAGTIGWSLLHSLWEGAIIATVLAVLLCLIRSPRARYAAACAAMLVMLGSSGFTFVRLMPNHAAGLQASNAPAFQAWDGPRNPTATEPSKPELTIIAPWLGPFWITGVWFICFWRLTSWFSVQRLRRRGVCSAPARWQRELGLLAARLRVSRPVLLLESCLADVPIVLGHFRPLILVPVGMLTGFPQEQIEAILLHELAHIRRHDYLVNLMQCLAEGLLFYHPAVWWISKIIRVERENCCDDLVVSVTRNAHEYAVALASLEQNRISGREPAIAATGGHLMNRIRRLLYPGNTKVAWAPLLTTVILLATGTVALAAWQAKPSAQSAAFAPAQAAATENTNYSKWLEENVVYIIDDAERAAFQKLTTDAEREQFIEQFWTRRNPTPGSSPNKFRVEHYRRIDYANKHFRTASGAPGWQTDRGHMYIVYGPPDEIEAHPKSAQRPLPTEIWLYRQVDGVGSNVSFTFIDRTGRGDFHLAPETAR